VGPVAGLDVSEKRKTLSFPGFKHRTVQPIAQSLYGLRSVGSRKARNEESKIEENKRKKLYTNIR
jgi:hypothetical protein